MHHHFYAFRDGFLFCWTSQQKSERNAISAFGKWCFRLVSFWAENVACADILFLSRIARCSNLLLTLSFKTKYYFDFGDYYYRCRWQFSFSLHIWHTKCSKFHRQQCKWLRIKRPTALTLRYMMLPLRQLFIDYYCYGVPCSQVWIFINQSNRKYFH